MRNADLVAGRTRSGARLLGLMVAGLFLLALVTEGADQEGFTPYTAILLALCAVSVLGIAVAWRRERAGGLLIKAGAGVSGIFAWAAASQTGLVEFDLLAFTQAYVILALLAGLLFLLSDRASSLPE